MSKKANVVQIAAAQNTLQSLAAEAAEISRLLMESQGELTPELEQRLEVNTQLLLQKTDNYNFIIEELESQAALWKRRKEACAAVEKRFAAQIDRLWDRIKLAMKEMGKTEIKGSLYRFKLTNSQSKLVIEDEGKVPAQFKMIIQMTTTDKEKLKAALKDGFEVPGAHLEENGTLRIYENSEE